MTEEKINGMPVINVNKRGRCLKTKERYDHIAAPDVVAKGYMVNQPVLLRFPNGKIIEGNRLMFPRSGMDWLQKNVPLSIREPSHRTPQ